jgi:hypothetical protein
VADRDLTPGWNPREETSILIGAEEKEVGFLHKPGARRVSREDEGCRNGVGLEDNLRGVVEEGREDKDTERQRKELQYSNGEEEPGGGV